MFRLIFLAKFRNDFSARDESKSIFFGARRQYYQACFVSEKFRAAEKKFGDHSQWKNFTDWELKRWEGRRLEMFKDEDLKELVRLATVVKRSLDEMVAAESSFAETCKDPKMNEIKSQIQL